MAINFPTKTEIRLKKSPLDEVICQVKFPPILKIVKESPIEIQEMVRSRFPVFQAEQGLIFKMPSIGSTEKPGVETPPKVHRFLTADGKAHLALAPVFYALATKKYTHWGDFLQELDTISQAVVQIYQPAYATRIGLRFINRFAKNNTGCKTIEELLELFRAELTCLIKTDAWTDPFEMQSQIVLKDRNAKLAIRTGLGRDKKEAFFILDFDYFEEGQLDLNKLDQRLERYHSKIYDAFRWCLKDESLVRFEPLGDEV